jgi:thiamine pyrophosphokinase
MVGLLLVGGKSPDKMYIEPLAKRADYIIAADSGLDYAVRQSIHVDLVVGDMDSLENRTALKQFPNERIILFDKEKDETDTEIGIRMLWEKNIKNITITGGGGGRLDHLLGIITLFDREVRPYQWITHSSRVVSIEESLEMDCEPGALVSFFPVGEQTCRMHSEGLKWELDGLEWKRGDMGVSNIIMKKRIHIAMKTGRIIMVKELGKEHILE